MKRDLLWRRVVGAKYGRSWDLVAFDLMVVLRFGIYCVMLQLVAGLLWHMKNCFSRHRSNIFWKAILLCLVWCIWKEWNACTFEGNELTLKGLSLYFSVFLRLDEGHSAPQSRKFLELLNLVHLNIRVDEPLPLLTNARKFRTFAKVSLCL